MDIRGTVSVITGGASGLGEATARRLVELGAAGVVILDVDDDRGKTVADELGDRCLYVSTDISDDEQVQAAVGRGLDVFGAVHAVVAAAGVAVPAKLLGRHGPLPMAKFDLAMKVNVYGTLHVIRAAAAAMLENEPNVDGERGVIVPVSSGAAFEGQIGQIGYGASKAALVGMTYPLARELGEHGIRVATIAPGAFDTPIYDGIPTAVKQSMIDLTVFPKRLGQSSEFALFVEEILRNPLHNARTYRFDGGMILPASS